MYIDGVDVGGGVWVWMCAYSISVRSMLFITNAVRSLFVIYCFDWMALSSACNAIDFVTNEHLHYTLFLPFFFLSPNPFLSLLLGMGWCFFLLFSATLFSLKLKIIFLTFTNDIILLRVTYKKKRKKILWSLFVCGEKQIAWLRAASVELNTKTSTNEKNVSSSNGVWWHDGKEKKNISHTYSNEKMYFWDAARQLKSNR